MRKTTFALIAGILILSIASCTKSNTIPTSKAMNQDSLDRIYNIDPYRKYIGTQLENYAFTDVVTDKSFQLKDFSGRAVIFESFSVGCPACVEGIKNYNYIYDKYGEKVQIIYLNINPADTAEDIINIKQRFNGRDWIWVKYSPEIKDFLLKYDIIGNDITYIVKDGKIVYADSLVAPISRIENVLIKVI